MYQENNTVKNIAILGSTGSIGTQALQVIDKNPDLFRAYVLTAQSSSTQLIEQAIRYLPAYVIITDADKYPIVKAALAHLPIKVMAGHSAITEVVTHPEIDTVLTAL